MILDVYPSARAKNVYTINYQKLKSLGYKGIIFDIDQTLVQHGFPVTAEVEQLFADIQTLGFTTFLLSNNEESRIAPFAKNLNSDFIELADKPATKNYELALSRMGLSKDEVLFIGDQLFTDVLGANRVGMKSILVDFLYDVEKDTIGKKRRLEQLMLSIYPWILPRKKRLESIEKGE